MLYFLRLLLSVSFLPTFTKHVYFYDNWIVIAFCAKGNYFMLPFTSCK